MTDLTISLKVGVDTEEAVKQTAHLAGIPAGLGENGARLWVRTYLRTVRISDTFPVDEWFTNLPGQDAEVQFNDTDRLCDDLRTSAEDEYAQEEAEELRAELNRIASETNNSSAVFALTLDD